MMDITTNNHDAHIALVISVATVCFLAYWFISHSDVLRRQLIRWRDEAYAKTYGALYRKAIGIFFLGLVPGLFACLVLSGSLSDYGVGAADNRLTIYWILGLGGILSFLPFFSVHRQDMLAYYPEVRARQWSWSLIVFNSLMWVVYLAAYEFLFRGFLLLNCSKVMGVWPAIAITTALSSATHMPKGPKETFGTIPFSVVLCLSVMQTGALWAALAIHAILALSNDLWALYFQPEMRLAR